MREIKFRALVKPLNTNQRWEYYSTLTMPTWLDFCKIIVKDLQFTGLKTKKGKEIYVGDVVKGRYVDDLNGERFENDEITELDPESPCRGYWEDCEIIGNIYENPELKENLK